MTQRLPPIEQIEAFIHAARAPSFRVASERCALSPAAFSRRIQAFSETVNMTLFVRTATGARLTRSGERCLAAFEPAYAELRRAADAVAERAGAGAAVTLSLSHSLAVGWLIPRLDSFHKAHPEVELQLRTERSAEQVRRGEADLGICASDVDTDGLASESLIPISVAPVASPDRAARLAAQGGDLTRERLLGYARPPGLWRWWASSTGHAALPEATASFEVQHALYEAAACGHGVGLAIGPTVAPFIDSGRLVRLPLPAARFPGEYRMVSAPKRMRRRNVSKLKRWLVSEAQRTPSFA